MLTEVSVLPAELGEKLHGSELIGFDGTCVLWSYFYRFVVRHDRAGRFRFATAQSPLGQALYGALDLSTDDFETNLVITRGHIYGELDSVAATCRAPGGIWTPATALGWLPRWIKSPLYRVIARNRFRLFGRFDSCMMPSPEARARFVEGGL